MSGRPDNKENLMSLADQVVWAIEEYIGTGVSHTPLFVGELWYVSKDGLDTNTGMRPDDAFLTIGAAIDAAAAGDGITVKAGIYDENALEMNLVALELWCEIGVSIIDTTTGAQTLLVSAASCRVTGLVINQAGQPGLKVTATGGWFEKIRVVASSIAYDINAQCVMIKTAASGYSATGYDFNATNIIVQDATAIGSGAGTRGFYLSGNAADRCLFDNLSSMGNDVAGYEVVAGALGSTFKDCSSGAGDGPRLDDTHGNVWSHYIFDDDIGNPITYAAGTTHNIFQVTGVVDIKRLYGVVTTLMENVSSAMHLEVFSSGGSVVITKIAGAPDVAALVVGSLLIKGAEAGTILTMKSAATPSVAEAIGADPDAQVIVIADADQDTFIRSNITAALASGVIEWHCKWEPLSDGAFVSTP